ncbi:MAG TPA: ACT domain protein [Leucothrix sp.]|nr:ACT domain protein [Leucothrix sp.]
MQISLVITILGPDRPGLVKALSQTLQQNQASWTESRMSHLAGKFAGLLRVSVLESQINQLTTDLQNMEDHSFKILIERTDSSTIKIPSKLLNLELLGQDRPGIIHDITQQLALLNVNIEELESEIKEASMSGEILFIAKLTLSLPENITADEVQNALESMSDQFMVDINFS